MRIKAFSLIEIIVVIILMGIIFSLVLNGYIDNRKNPTVSIKDMGVGTKEDATLFVYGKDCKKAILELDDNIYLKSSNFGFSNEDRVFKANSLNALEEVKFDSHIIKNKKEKICFKLDFRDKRFFERFVILSKGSYYLFSPLDQSVQKFSLLEEAEKRFKNDDLYPGSVDGYYRE